MADGCRRTGRVGSDPVQGGVELLDLHGGESAHLRLGRLDEHDARPTAARTGVGATVRMRRGLGGQGSGLPLNA